eukprot:TRINITY_DN18335_c0_g1_i2.p1 TRINITY_DN18335_c0_g1~~TRINITY_DN18335_c0_g1_i2.p1  ORF type:complete len:270 (+),score=23.14 TRINITY_DN18335_c0_g1_i2:560-1369(+)
MVCALRRSSFHLALWPRFHRCLPVSCVNSVLLCECMGSEDTAAVEEQRSGNKVQGTSPSRHLVVKFLEFGIDYDVVLLVAAIFTAFCMVPAGWLSSFSERSAGPTTLTVQSLEDSPSLWVGKKLRSLQLASMLGLVLQVAEAVFVLSVFVNSFVFANSNGCLGLFFDCFIGYSFAFVAVGILLTRRSLGVYLTNTMMQFREEEVRPESLSSTEPNASESLDTTAIGVPIEYAAAGHPVGYFFDAGDLEPGDRPQGRSDCVVGRVVVRVL